jgi:hypothetical protein
LKTVKREFRRGQFGGTFGGPLFLPGFGEGTSPILNLKDKAFFFADYEGLRQFLPLNPDTATVPTVAFRNGDFSALTTQLRDPLTGLNVCNTPGVATCNGTPYNRLDLLPGNRLNPVALNYLRAFPLPTRAGTLGNYVTTRNQLLNLIRSIFVSTATSAKAIRFSDASATEVSIKRHLRVCLICPPVSVRERIRFGRAAWSSV